MSLRVSTVDLGGSTIHCAESGRAEAQFIYKEIFVDQCYSAQGFALDHGGTVIDVGANIGLFTRFLCGRFRDLRVVCFEPSPPTFECLRANTEDLDAQVETIRAAVSDHLGTAQIEYLPNLPGNSTLYPADKRGQVDSFAENLTLADAWRGSKLAFFVLLALYPVRKWVIRKRFEWSYSGGVSYDCPLTTLDATIAERGLEQVDLLKIDVEGAELDVLGGLSDANLGRVQQLIMEVSPSNLGGLDALRERLARSGFDAIHIESAVPKGDSAVYGCNVFARRGGPS